MHLNLLSKMSAGAMAAALLAVATLAVPGTMKAQAAGNTVLKPADLEKLLPAAVYYRGQTATTQLRNSGGVKFADGYYVLATMADTSGYASEIAAKYQAYFIAEVPIKINGQKLGAGVYGIGFVNGKFLVTDVGGHDVLTANVAQDAAMKRPVPLQITLDPGDGYRIYAGRKYVTFSR